MSNLLRVDEAAGRLALGRSKVYELIAAGELESVAIGSARRVPDDAVDNYIARLRANDAAAPAKR